MASSVALRPPMSPPRTVASPVGVVESAADLTLDHYQFPAYRLRPRLSEPNRTPLVLVACGSFIGGFMSPVSDAYKKAGLAPSYHRVKMCELAVANDDYQIAVDPWEALQPDYVPTARVLDHFEQEIDKVFPDGVLAADGESRVKPRIALLAGADLIQTMSTPGLWSDEDLERILGDFGAFIIERDGTNIHKALAGLDRWRKNIHVIRQVFQNNMSSTQIRLHIKRDMSVRFLIPDAVISYIYANGLYQDLPSHILKQQPSHSSSSSGSSPSPEPAEDTSPKPTED